MSERWQWSVGLPSGNMVFSPVFEDFHDAYDDMVRHMTERQRNRGDIATFRWRGVYTTEQCMNIMQGLPWYHGMDDADDPDMEAARCVTF